MRSEKLIHSCQQPTADQASTDRNGHAAASWQGDDKTLSSDVRIPRPFEKPLESHTTMTGHASVPLVVSYSVCRLHPAIPGRFKELQRAPLKSHLQEQPASFNVSETTSLRCAFKASSLLYDLDPIGAVVVNLRCIGRCCKLAMEPLLRSSRWRWSEFTQHFNRLWRRERLHSSRFQTDPIQKTALLMRVSLMRCQLALASAIVACMHCLPLASFESSLACLIATHSVECLNQHTRLCTITGGNSVPGTIAGTNKLKQKNTVCQCIQ